MIRFEGEKFKLQVLIPSPYCLEKIETVGVPKSGEGQVREHRSRENLVL